MATIGRKRIGVVNVDASSSLNNDDLLFVGDDPFGTAKNAD